MPTTVVGSPVVLRQLRKEDVPVLYEMYLEYPRMICHSKIFGIDWLYKVVEDDTQLRYSIYPEDSHELLGCTTLWWASQFDGIASPTLWIGHEFQRRGYGFTALATLLRRGFTTMGGLRKITAGVYGYNHASLALSRRLFGPEVAVLPGRVFHMNTYWPQHLFEKDKDAGTVLDDPKTA